MKINPEISTFQYAFDFANKLKKGDTFVLNEREHTVKCLGKWKSDAFKKEFKTVTIKSSKEQIKLYIINHDICGNPASMSRGSHTKQYGFLRDVEGVILVDLLNSKNKLHDISNIFKIAIS